MTNHPNRGKPGAYHQNKGNSGAYTINLTPRAALDEKTIKAIISEAKHDPEGINQAIRNQLASQK